MVIIDYKEDFAYPDDGLDIHWYRRKSESNAYYITPHGHNHYEFFVITKGSILQILNSNSIELHLLDSQLIRPGDVHGFKLINKNEEVEHLNIGANEEVFISLCDTLGEEVFNTIQYSIENNQNLSTFFLEKEEFEYVNKLAKGIQNKAANNSRQINLIKAILIVFINSFYNHIINLDNQMPLWLRDLFIEINKPSNIAISSKDVYRIANYSSTMTNTYFKKYIGATVNKYLQSRKIDYAKNVLKTTNYSISEICETIGIKSTSYFNHMFVSATGLTPLKYRKLKNKQFL